MEIVNNFNKVLNLFSIKANCVDYKDNNNYYYYDLKLESKTKIKDITKYNQEISLFLKSKGTPSIKVITEKGIVRLEFMKERKNKLKLFDYFTNNNIPKGELICLLGQSVDGSRVWMDMCKNPHMIVSGTTGSGKSTLLHNLIANCINYNKSNIYIMDPKNIEFSDYSCIKNINISHSYNECFFMMESLVGLMESRYKLIRNGFSIKELPAIFIIIDEFSDLILQDKNNEFYNLLLKLSQKCRAAKMHIVLSTQRPSADIISGAIKTNFPARIACKVSSHVDSKVVLDAVGAENLLGYGDALLKDNIRNLERFQIAFTDSSEVTKIFGNI